MTRKQQRFCDEYLKDLNATQAAIRAGYSKKTARSSGQRMLTNVDVKDYIDDQLDKMHNEKVADAQEIMEYLTSVVRGGAKEQALRMVHGTQEIVDVDVPNRDRMKAAELLGKANGMFNNNLNVNMSLPVFYDGESDLDE